MKILCTGGKGYVASNLKEFIEREGWGFTSYDIVNGLDITSRTLDYFIENSKQQKSDLD